MLRNDSKGAERCKQTIPTWKTINSNQSGPNPVEQEENCRYGYEP